MGSDWAKHVGEWYNKNKGGNGIYSLKDAMQSEQCKAEWNIKKSKGKTMHKKGKKHQKSRKMKGGNNIHLSPMEIASATKVDATTPIKGGNNIPLSPMEIVSEVKVNDPSPIKGGKKNKKM
jgi:hypothetical protein